MSEQTKWPKRGETRAEWEHHHGYPVGHVAASKKTNTVDGQMKGVQEK